MWVAIEIVGGSRVNFGRLWSALWIQINLWIHASRDVDSKLKATSLSQLRLWKAAPFPANCLGISPECAICETEAPRIRPPRW